MLSNSKAFSGFSVDDTQKAKEFYGKTLGLKVSGIAWLADVASRRRQ
jgi:extradiol dioxygenase family protein